jgi:hypothetical protein
MLMVILGAGASFDSSPTHPASTGLHDVTRPPLAAQLFDPRFGAQLRSFEKALAIAPRLRASKTTIEAELERLQAQATQYPIRHVQLAAIRQYLRAAIMEAENHWRQVTQGVTNYVTLLDDMQRTRRGSELVPVVTFNYDTMVEEAIRVFTGRPAIRKLDEYMASPFPLFKVHGSVDWGRCIDAPSISMEGNDWAVAQRVMENAPSLKLTDEFEIMTQVPMARSAQGRALFPALAIPVEAKAHFECPQAHLTELEKLLPEVDKLLVIGWRGRERPFLDLLTRHVRRKVNVMAVGGNPQAANETLKELSGAGLEGTLAPAPKGFSDFIIERECEKFLEAL